MPAKSVPDEVLKARRAVNQTLATLARVHGQHTIRAAVNRWLAGERATRAALAEIRQAERRLQELKAAAVAGTTRKRG